MFVTMCEVTFTLDKDVEVNLYVYTVNLYLEVTFGTKKMRSSKTGDLLKEVQFMCNFL